MTDKPYLIAVDKPEQTLASLNAIIETLPEKTDKDMVTKIDLQDLSRSLEVLIVNIQRAQSRDDSPAEVFNPPVYNTYNMYQTFDKYHRRRSLKHIIKGFLGIKSPSERFFDA